MAPRPKTAPAKTFKITVAKSNVIVTCRADQTVLDAAIAAGIDYPYMCTTGNCGTCLSELESGEVTMLPYGDGALSGAQRSAGRVLACRAQPRSDAAITWLGRGRK